MRIGIDIDNVISITFIIKGIDIITGYKLKTIIIVFLTNNIIKITIKKYVNSQIIIYFFPLFVNSNLVLYKIFFTNKITNAK